MHHKAKAHLYAIVESCEAIIRKVSALTIEDYDGSWELQAIVERKLITIGEAVAQIRELDFALYEQIPDAPLIVGIRNKITHGYLTIDNTIVLDAAQNHIPILQKICEELL